MRFGGWIDLGEQASFGPGSARATSGRLAALAALLGLLAVAAAGCGGGEDVIEGSGVRASETRPVEPFTRVETRGGVEVTISLGGEQSLIVETDDNVIGLVTTEVRDGTLTIDVGKPRGWTTTLGIDVRIRVPALDSVAVAGSGQFDVQGLDADLFNAAIEGSGGVTVTGIVEVAEVEVSGSGTLRLAELDAQDVVVSVNGSGRADVRVSGSLVATVTGSGRIVYGGDPDSLETRIEGSGRIEREPVPDADPTTDEPEPAPPQPSEP
jgi:hypothetical protein